MNIPQFCPESIEPTEIKRISKETGIEFTLHLPEETGLATFHEAVRLGHAERCKEAALWAGQSGIRRINLHINNGVYVCDDFEGGLSADTSEVSELRWFPFNDVPENLSPPVNGIINEFIRQKLSKASEM